jgi:hypothetical protein
MSEAFTSLQEAQKHVSQQIFSVAKQIQKARGLDWASAWNAALLEHPELSNGWTKFLFVPEDDGTIGVIPPQQSETDDVAAKARAMKCDESVRKVQAENPDTSYHDAWLIAKAEHKQLFEGPVAISDRCDVLLRKLDAISGRKNSGLGAVLVVGIRQEI